MIFLDEIDKLDGTGDWCQHLRVEVFRLLDLIVPPDLIDENDRKIDPMIFSKVSEFLKHRTFLIAAGAFQSLWEAGNKQIGGFGRESIPDAPTPELLSHHLHTELINRFRTDIVVLEPLGIADYESMLLASTEKMPPHLQERFLLMGERRIDDARRNKQGVRFLEELLADVIAEDHPEPVVHSSPKTQTPSRWRLGSPQTRAPGFW